MGKKFQVRVQLEGLLPEEADGEIQCGTFSETTSVVMSANVSRNITYYWFDWAYDVSVPYQDRIDAAFKYFIMSIRHIKLQTVTIVPLVPKIIQHA